MKKAIAIILNIMLVLAITLPAAAIKSIAVKSIKLKRMKTVLAILLVLVMSLMLLTSCGSKTTETLNTNDKSVATNDTSTPKVEAPLFKKYDPEVTITTARWINTNNKYRDGDSWNNNPWTKMVKDKFGIVFKDSWSSPDWSSFESKLALNLAAGEPMPDVVFDFWNPGNTTLAKIMESSDILMPMNGIYEKYASKFVKDSQALFLDEVRQPFTKNGMLYALPNTSDGMGNANCLYLRKDWLDQTGLQAPATIDDVDKILEAFKKLNPKGTGLTITLKDGITTYMADTSWIFGAYGAIPSMWIKGSDGKLVYGSIKPEIKEGLAKLREWYSKGYINSQAAMLNCWDMVTNDYASEKAGVISAPVWFYSQMKDTLLKNNTKADILACPLPVGPSGKTMSLGSSKIANVFFFSKDFKNIEAFFNYYNSCYEASNDATTSDFKYGLIKGFDYDIGADGKPVYSDADMKKVNGLGEYPNFGEFMVGFNNFRTVPYKRAKINEALLAGKVPVTPSEISANSSPLFEKQAMSVIYNEQDIYLPDAYSGPSPKDPTLWNSLKQKELTVFTQIIYGQKPLSDFDKFVTEWKAGGGDAITKEFNTWYASTQK